MLRPNQHRLLFRLKLPQLGRTYLTCLEAPQRSRNRPNLPVAQRQELALNQLAPQQCQSSRRQDSNQHRYNINRQNNNNNNNGIRVLQWRRPNHAQLRDNAESQMPIISFSTPLRSIRKTPQTKMREKKRISFSLHFSKDASAISLNHIIHFKFVIDASALWYTINWTYWYFFYSKLCN